MIEQPDRAERGMAAHLHFVVRHEKAKVVVAAITSGKDKGTLVAVPCGDPAHRFAIELSGVDDDGCRVAASRSIPEHVDRENLSGVPPI